MLVQDVSFSQKAKFIKPWSFSYFNIVLNFGIMVHTILEITSQWRFCIWLIENFKSIIVGILNPQTWFAYVVRVISVMVWHFNTFDTHDWHKVICRIRKFWANKVYTREIFNRFLCIIEINYFSSCH